MDIDKTIADNMGLVYKQLNKFSLYDDPEAFSAGQEALLVAAKTYDNSKNIKFSTYASVCIYNALGVYLRSLNKKKQLVVVSYDARVDESDGLSYLDMLGHEDTPEAYLLQSEEHYKLWQAFSKAYSDLTSVHERIIIRAWRESDFTKTQVELAKEAGVSQAHVSRTLSAFKHKLKKELEEYLC